MRTHPLVLLTTVSLLTSLALSGGSPARTHPSVSIAASPVDQVPVRATAGEAYGKLPLSFEANRGQTDPAVDFLARGSGYTLFVTANEAVLSLRPAAHPVVDHARGEQQDMNRRSGSVLRMQLLGGSAALGVASDELPGKVNYFIGNDPSRWRTQIPTFAKVVYPEAYPGVDLAYYGDQGRLEYDFIVKPGADPAAIALRYAGADEVRLDAGGDLVLRLGSEEIRQNRPLAYQEVDGKRLEVPAAYRLGQHGDVGFDVGAHDGNAPLVIDPVLAYSTYLGGIGDDEGFGIAVDSAGNAFVTGFTTSTNFPTTTGAFQTVFTGYDAFVTKLNPLGNGLVYSTYLGGSGGPNIGYGIALDFAGNAYVAGQAGSNFPTTTGAFQTTCTNLHAFVTKLNPLGNGLVYSTCLGGSQSDVGRGIAIDAGGNAYVTGASNSTDFPTTAGAFQTTSSVIGAFVTKLNPVGTGLVYSTYLTNSTGGNAGFGIAVDSFGSAYMTGPTGTGFPTTPGAFQTSYAGNGDAFMTKLNAAGSALLYSTYLGGSDSEAGNAIAVDASGNAYVTGFTTSENFPTTAGAVQTAHGCCNDAFVTKLNPTASAPLVYSTYLGGNNQDGGGGIAVDTAGDAYVTGVATSTNFPTAAAFQPANAGAYDAFVTKLNPGGGLVYSTYLGGSGGDAGQGIAVDSTGNAYVTGLTGSTNFPTTAGAFQTTFGGYIDAFVAKIGVSPSTAGCEVTITQGGRIITNNGDRASFGGNAKVSADGTTVQGQEQYTDLGPAQPRDVHSIQLTATTCSADLHSAMIFGRATIDGSGNHAFRIDVIDGGQGGSNDKYGISLDTGYTSGLQPLQGGNVTIH